MPAPSQKAREYYEKTYGFIGGPLNNLELKEAGEFDSFTLELREALRDIIRAMEGEGLEWGCVVHGRSVLASYTPSPEEEKG